MWMDPTHQCINGQVHHPTPHRWSVPSWDSSHRHSSSHYTEQEPCNPTAATAHYAGKEGCIGISATCAPYSGRSASAASLHSCRQDHAFPLPQLICVSAASLFGCQLRCVRRLFLRRCHTGIHIYSLQRGNPWQNQTQGPPMSSLENQWVLLGLPTDWFVSKSAGHFLD